MPTKHVFEVHWEPFFSLYPYSSFWEENDPLVEEPTYYLLDLLRRHEIKATWYCVGWLIDKQRNLFDFIEKEGHKIGWHTYYHTGPLSSKYPDNFMDSDKFLVYRSPRWKGEKRLYSGGFWLRLMPYWWLKREVLKSGTFFVHPHDLLFEHPKCGIRTFDRRLGLKTARDKLERLCRQVEFKNEMPSL